MSNLPVPSLAAPVTGFPISQSYLTSQVYNPLTFAFNKPIFNAVQASTTDTLTSGISWTSLTFKDSAGIYQDTYGGHSLTTNPSRYVAQVAGWYTINGCATFSTTSTTGERGVRIAKNGTQVQGMCTMLQAPTTTSVSPAIPTPTRDVFLNAGDYVEVQALQNSGVQLTTIAGTDLSSGLYVRFSHV
ncbi:hypothetical protein [Streptomyces roseochromogenus]|uniref:C1q domain-containing protein n=1 Tax=Streptomyces roseochromogenus subsp. oscitans DS 12.976 TaxID=1352936 RepID=V6K604_STRRC|nr:hypothetical protein [Streptomyces roseochromogenus]EST24394.1 hypothetical protein M878_30745 [Streptomyces roseochromogenus subsp. oscitans DS 12.976]